MEAIGETISKDALVGVVREGMRCFTTAVKQFAFYPETNQILQTSLGAVQAWFDEFLERHESLRLSVEKDSLLFQGEVVHQERPHDQALAFPLFRDGVQWLEFQDGITDDELRTFITLLNRFRILKEESEDDLVTAMWEADFLFLKYKTADEFWEMDPLIDLSSLKVVDDSFPDIDVEMETLEDGEAVGVALKPLADYENFLARRGGSGGTKPVSSLFNLLGELTDEDLAAGGGWGSSPDAFRAVDKLRQQQPFAAAGDNRNLTTSIIPGSGERGGFWRLSPAEEKRLRKMIAGEEQRNTTRDCLEILLILVNDPEVGKDHGEIQDFIVEEVHNSLARGEFGDMRAFMERVASLARSGSERMRTFAAQLSARLAAPEVLDAMNRFWPYVHTLSDPALGELARFLLLLPSESIKTLVPMLARNKNERVHKVLMSVVAAEACRDPVGAAEILGILNASTLCELLHMIKSSRTLAFPDGLFKSLTRDESYSVREAAARALLERDHGLYRELFHLIDDPQPGINRLICSHLGRDRDPDAEELLFDYLRNAYEQNRSLNDEHVINCYFALAKCGSAGLIPFLREVLMRKDWKSILGIETVAHRRGAALALMLMPEDWGAKAIFEEAMNNPFRHIRQACRFAGEELTRRKRKHLD